jgi:hypothetical protein
MKLYRFIKILPLLVVFSSGLLNAQVIPGRWEKVDSQPVGKQIIVTLKAGDRIEYALKESGADDLTVVDSTGRELKIAKSEVSKVETEDGIRNGVLIGAAVGFAGPVIVTLASGVDRTEVPFGFAIGVIGAGVGAAVGYLLDKKRKGTQVLYQAP